MDASKKKKTSPAETILGNFFALCVYAHFADKKADWNGDAKYSPIMDQSYENLIKPKDSQMDVKAIFTVSPEMKQYLVYLLNKLCDEIAEIKLVEGDTMVTINGKLNEALAESFTIAMSNAVHKTTFGPTLTKANDPTSYINSSVAGKMKAYAGQPILIAILSTEFTNFVKQMAMYVGNIIWYTSQSVSGDLANGLLANMLFPQIMIDQMAGALRPKAVKVAKKKDVPAPAAAAAADEPPKEVIAGDVIGDALANI